MARLTTLIITTFLFLLRAVNSVPTHGKHMNVVSLKELPNFYSDLVYLLLLRILYIIIQLLCAQVFHFCPNPAIFLVKPQINP